MARLDPIFDRLFKEQALEAAFESGTPGSLRTPGSLCPLRSLRRAPGPSLPGSSGIEPIIAELRAGISRIYSNDAQKKANSWSSLELSAVAQSFLSLSLAKNTNLNDRTPRELQSLSLSQLTARVMRWGSSP